MANSRTMRRQRGCLGAKLKARSEFRIVGKAAAAVDIPTRPLAATKYGIDVQCRHAGPP